MNLIGRYFYNLAYSLDQFANTVWGGCPDETISSRIGRLDRAGRLRWLPRVIKKGLHVIDKNHCADAIENGEIKPGARAVADVLDRCESAIVRGGVVYRCRLAHSHPGKHLGRVDRRGLNRSVEW